MGVPMEIGETFQCFYTSKASGRMRVFGRGEQVRIHRWRCGAHLTRRVEKHVPPPFRPTTSLTNISIYRSSMTRPLLYDLYYNATPLQGTIILAFPPPNLRIFCLSTCPDETSSCAISASALSTHQEHTTADSIMRSDIRFF
jgi:hypothetical protein